MKAASGKYDIIGYMKKKNPKLFISDEPRYKLEIEALPEKPTILEKTKSLLGLNDVVELSRDYHTENGTECLMYQRLKARHIAKCLNITL